MKILLFTILCYFVRDITGHGFMTFPIARQHRCHRANDFWWPPNGDNIRDVMCRAAYKYVYNKVLDITGDPTVAASEAQYMFMQTNEYAALAGPNFYDMCHIKERVVPSDLCAAGANDFREPFGDKSGVSIVGSWTPTVFELTSNTDLVYPVELEFCPTAIHEPSYFEVYITKPEFSVFRDKVIWPLLDILFNDTVALVPRLPNSICTASPNTYRFVVPIPYRQSQFVLYVRWQRIDPVGEGFYNCVDMVFDQALGPDPEDVIPPPDDVDYDDIVDENGNSFCPLDYGAGPRIYGNYKCKHNNNNNMHSRNHAHRMHNRRHNSEKMFYKKRDDDRKHDDYRHNDRDRHNDRHRHDHKRRHHDHHEF